MHFDFTGKYPKRDIINLARFISVQKFRPLIWRNTHSYMLADRLEDLTDNALIEVNPVCDRTVALFGWVRGTYMKPNQRVHLMGVGDFDIQDLTLLPDPCPSAKGETKKKKLNEKDKKLHAPMADVGDVMYDKDAM